MVNATDVLAVNNFGDTRSGGLAGPMGLFIIVLLSIATVLLIRNMNARLRRLPDSFPDPVADRRAAEIARLEAELHGADPVASVDGTSAPGATPAPAAPAPVPTTPQPTTTQPTTTQPTTTRSTTTRSTTPRSTTQATADAVDVTAETPERRDRN